MPPGVSTKPAKELERARSTRQSAEVSLANLEAEREAIFEERDVVYERHGQVATDLELARKVTRRLLVNVYVGGGQPSSIAYLLDSDSAAELSWREFLVENHIETATDAAATYERLRESVDEELATYVERLDDATARVEAARLEVMNANVVEKAAQQRLYAAEQDRLASQRAAAAEQARQQRAQQQERERQQARASAQASSGGSPSAAAWLALRMCESGNNYQAVSRDGRYMGAYQFDQSTWNWMGGTGRPHHAAPEEQDLRALLLYQRRGAAPWPVCGRHLR